MSEAGERMLEGAREAVAIAKGEQPAASIWIKGHRYVLAEWQEIGTAPKDGTRILIYYAASNPYVKQQWSANEHSRFVRLAKWENGLWRLDMAGHFRTDPTRWMPLPPPPQ